MPSTRSTALWLVATYNLVNTLLLTGSTSYSYNYFNVPGTPVFVYGIFYCTGSEQSLLDCSYSSYNSLINYCSYNELAGVRCVVTYACTNNGEIRLRGGNTNNRIGQVEVCVNGTWSTICNENWDNNDAVVICNQLGFSSYGTKCFIKLLLYCCIGSLAAYGTLSYSVYPIRMYGVNCTGNENTLFECPFHVTSVGTPYKQCGYAGVVCQSNISCTCILVSYI